MKLQQARYKITTCSSGDQLHVHLYFNKDNINIWEGDDYDLQYIMLTFFASRVTSGSTSAINNLTPFM